MTNPIMTFTCSVCGATEDSPIEGEFSCGTGPPYRAQVPGTIPGDVPVEDLDWNKEWAYLRPVYSVGINWEDHLYEDDLVGEEVNLVLCPTCSGRTEEFLLELRDEAAPEL